MADPNRTTGHLVLVSVPEAAAQCGLPEAAIRRWIAEGELTAIPFGPAPMVNPAEVAALRERRIGGPGAGGRGGWSRRRLRALAVANVAAGLGGCLVFLGVGPAGLREPWWLALCLASVLVGLLVWLLAVRPDGRQRRARRDPGAF